VRTSNSPYFLITIDTEGDNLWSAPKDIQTLNAAFLWRFQDLCEEFGLKPTYLTNYEMVRSPEFQRLGRYVIRNDSGEIGMHLHAWNSPPISPLTADDYSFCPFLIEYKRPIMEEKVKYLTKLLSDTFGLAPISHRAGRWAFDQHYAEILIECGYKIDCSVTPGINWRSNQKSARAGVNGTDYRGFNHEAYWLDPLEISRPGTSNLLELPMTIYMDRNWSWIPSNRVRALVNRFAPEEIWLRPTGRNLSRMLWVVQRVLSERRLFAEFMLHSSEFMPGGSPLFQTKKQVEKLYEDLRILFQSVVQHFRPATLTNFYNDALADQGLASSKEEVER
jgi:hypothetical protein